MTTTQNNTITIDATDRSIGRIATEAADALRGKNSPAYSPEKLSGNTVHIVNAKLAKIPAGRMKETYIRYSGYPGGQKAETKAKVVARHGIARVFERAVFGMIPNNRLRPKMMKNLVVSE